MACCKHASITLGALLSQPCKDPYFKAVVCDGCGRQIDDGKSEVVVFIKSAQFDYCTACLDKPVGDLLAHKSEETPPPDAA